MYDDNRYCNVMHPLYPGKPIDSSRFTFLDFGTTKVDGGRNNIMMIAEKNTFSYGHVPGRLTPAGLVKGGASNSKIPGYTHFIEDSCGIAMFDPTRGGELFYDINNL